MPIDIQHLNVVLMMGVVVFGGILGAKLFQRLHVPQVIGYIVIGAIIGESGLKIISTETIKTLEPLNFFALGIIGFMIGGELKAEIFKKYGKQFMSILLGEGITAFLLVGAASGAIYYLFTKDIQMASAVGLVLGAISSATDPASTIQVLWEYKTRGVLTTAATAIVALDDALALTLYGIGTSVAGIIAGGAEGGVAASLLSAVYELGGAIVLGVAGGFILQWILKRTHDTDSMLTFAVGSVLLTIGLSIALHFDVILSSMCLGLTIVNIAPRLSSQTFNMIQKFSPPIYILFFVFVGAGIQIQGLKGAALAIAAGYVVFRSLGKVGGAFIGAKISGAQAVVKKYLGCCLFAQGGVAVGLSIMASHKFADQPEIAQMIVLVVTATTLFVQLLGPVSVKYAVKKAGEIGLNVTEEDLIKKYKVRDVMVENPVTIYASQTLDEVLRIFSENDFTYYPVVEDSGKVIGSMSIEGIKETLKYRDTASWLLACDIMKPMEDHISPDMELEEAMRYFRAYNIDYACVIEDGSDKIKGLFDIRLANKKISAEVIKCREHADHGETCPECTA
ncbi:cation:proton antiporter [Sedimentisphaera salicampi]|uniref:Putative voltage-gated ClC-type chloride channel ClcB n=1 Tax=Sedimentisphaera salicampi TaxID=1941349 RepID=A0A1W6LKN2_9BACT|nr:cation:proton antiporter [Sedimentisphaera salicampi]ARN56358.1 putative voltage-gated ClC-type chloride channel ClcB [Sedimentisphaera salicampi]